MGSGKGSAESPQAPVTFEEASTVFGDRLGITYLDPGHSEHEQRFVTLGASIANRVLVVIHLEDDERIRIISARKADAGEREDYEEAQKHA